MRITNEKAVPPLRACLVALAIIVAGIVIAHDGIAGALRIGIAVVALLVAWFATVVIRGMLYRNAPRDVQPSYIDVAVAQSYALQGAVRQDDSR